MTVWYWDMWTEKISRRYSGRQRSWHNIESVHFFTPASDKRNSVHSGTAALASRYIVDSAKKLNCTVSSEAESGNDWEKLKRLQKLHRHSLDADKEINFNLLSIGFDNKAARNQFFIATTTQTFEGKLITENNSFQVSGNLFWSTFLHVVPVASF